MAKAKAVRQHFVERNELGKGREGSEETLWLHWNLITKGQRETEREKERQKVRREQCKYNLIEEGMP